ARAGAVFTGALDSTETAALRGACVFTALGENSIRSGLAPSQTGGAGDKKRVGREAEGGKKRQLCRPACLPRCSARNETVGLLRSHLEELPAGPCCALAADIGRNMNGNKTNCVLLTVFIILAVFCSSGYMLKCYNCPLVAVPCKTNITCQSDLDSCLWLKIGERMLSNCYRYSNCNTDRIKEEYKFDNFEFKCCQKDLCNRSQTTMISTAVFSIATMMTMIWILCF
ncbi:CD59 molecule, partial [Chelydra serpentina]